jgi:MFS family permease
MSVGSIVALPITPYIADIFGRRAGVITGCVIMIVGVVLQSIGANIQMFIAARFLIGFGVAIAHGSAPLLITELVHPQHRAIFTTIYNSTWYFGSIVAAWLTYGMFIFSTTFKKHLSLSQEHSRSPAPGPGASPQSSRLAPPSFN